jgi:cell division protein FtsZ
MARMNPNIETFARIKVIGVGGSGKSALNHMISNKVTSVEFIAVNADVQDLHNSLAEKKIHIGKNYTRGLGAGMEPEKGKRAAEETREEIQDAIAGADMAFIASGMGGGTGTGASPVVAKIAREQGILTIAVVTKPFFFEGRERMRLAEEGLADLEKEVDAMIVIPNDRILGAIDQKTSVKSAFAMCDEILRQAVEGISDLITTPGTFGNIDFADIRTILADSGTALMGVGTAQGDNRAVEAASRAINSPLLDVSINGAKGVLFSISGSEDLSLYEVQEAAKIITESVDKDAKIIFGTTISENLKKDEVKVTVIATGFPNSHKYSGVANDRKDPYNVITNIRNTSSENNFSSSEYQAPKEQSSSLRNFFGGAKTEIREEEDEDMPEIVIPQALAEVKEIKKEEKISQASISPEPKKEIKKEAAVIDLTDESDDWNALPAFMRRNK